MSHCAQIGNLLRHGFLGTINKMDLNSLDHHNLVFFRPDQRVELGRMHISVSLS